jgi:hypothetical protein
MAQWGDSPSCLPEADHDAVKPSRTPAITSVHFEAEVDPNRLTAIDTAGRNRSRCARLTSMSRCGKHVAGIKESTACTLLHTVARTSALKTRLALPPMGKPSLSSVSGVPSASS